MVIMERACMWGRQMIFGKALRRGLLVMLGAAAMGFAARVAAQDIKTETVEYYDDLAIWVVGQVERTTVNGIEASKTDYGWKALPWKSYSFGKPQQTLSYDSTSTVASGQLGTLKTVTDGRNNATTLTLWKRGVPGKVTYPATTDQPTAVSQSAVINDDGTIAQVTDENGFVTKYDYDAMGRLSLIDYPDGDTVAWTSTTLDFAFKPGVRGLPSHWRLWEYTGSGYKVTRYDALWRPVVEETYVNGDATSYSIVVKRYDAGGRLAFQSYPLANLSNYADTTLKGIDYTYDALDRPRVVSQDSELGALTTVTDYMSNADGYYTRVKNPRGYYTRTWYQAFDEPSYDYPVEIWHSDAAYTDITRDVFTKPTSIKRRNVDGTISSTRTYAYHTVGQELCRMVEPETGATLMGYDGAGNLAWSASGLATGTLCDIEGDTAAILARKAERTYDARNRLKTLSFPNGLGDTTSTWTPDGLLSSIVADNGGGNLVTTNYTYNKRRLPTNEQMLWGSINWSLGHTYNTNGHLASDTYPGPLTVSYAPDALGRATQAGAFASGVSYYPNGAIKEFTYGNGITHTLTQNVRQLPHISADAYGTTAYLSDTYEYDENGNVAAITDGATSRNQRGNRDMVYDGLDRLTSVVSPMFGTATYAYDVLDNLTRNSVTGGSAPHNYYYCYNAKWQLAFVRNGSVCTGSTPSPAVTALEYDVQGNLSVKNAQDFTFDFGNRLRGATTPTSSNVYDGHGRRVRDYTTAGKYSFYAQSGQLGFVKNARTGNYTNYVYLGGSLVATREWPIGGGTVVTTYQHTDALGSPVVMTDANRGPVRYEYEPYGKGGPPDEPGYTGHVLDGATGLLYMQQRYYDPQIGRFLSVDPVTANSGTGANFNRYKYASNNPYRFFDPDGRQERPIDCAGTRINCDTSSASVQSEAGAAAAQQAFKQRGGGAGNGAESSVSSTLGKVAAAGRALTGALDSSLGATSETAPKKVGDFVGSEIIKRWQGASKAEVESAKAVGKLSQGVSLISMGISAWDFRAARNAGDTPGMVSAGTSFGFGAIGLTPWGAPGAIAFGATSLVMDTPLGREFSSEITDGMCSVSGNC